MPTDQGFLLTKATMSLSPNLQRGTVPTWKVRSALTSTPALCVDLASEIKPALRVTHNLEDTYIAGLATAAQDAIQLWTGRVFTTATMIGNADNPLSASTWWDGTIQMPAVAIFGNPRGIDLPGVPLASVQTFNFIDISGNSILFDPTTYYVDVTDKDRPGRIVFKYTTVFPAVPKEIASMVIAYTVGYGAAAAVPMALKQAILRLTAFLYFNRGDCPADNEDLMAASGAGALAQLYKVYNL